jgi:hypothetical protein
MEIVRTKDTGTLQYDIYFNDDQSASAVALGTTIAAIANVMSIAAALFRRFTGSPRLP